MPKLPPALRHGLSGLFVLVTLSCSQVDTPTTIAEPDVERHLGAIQLCTCETQWARSESAAPPPQSWVLPTNPDQRLPQPKKGAAANSWGSYFQVLKGSGTTTKISYAGQYHPVGTVTVDAGATGITVTYNVEAPNWLNEAHVYLGYNRPTTSAPGQFPYKNSSLATQSYTVGPIAYSSLAGYTAGGTVIYVAAHGVVGPLNCGDPCPDPDIVTEGTLPNAACDTPYSAQIQVSGGTPPYNFEVTSGSLPAGLSLNAQTGVISGTPTGCSGSTFVITVGDTCTCPGFAADIFQEFTIGADAPAPLTIDGPQLDCMAVGQPFTAAFSANGTAPYSWSVSPNDIGLSIDATGTVSGTPTSLPASLTVSATDSSCCPRTGSLESPVSECTTDPPGNSCEHPCLLPDNSEGAVSAFFEFPFFGSSYGITFTGVATGGTLEDALPYNGFAADGQGFVPNGTTTFVSLYGVADALPSYAQDPDWDLVNWVLNHKQHDDPDTEPTCVQDAILYFLAETALPSDPHALAMIADAQANGNGFQPNEDQLNAIIVDGGPEFPLSLIEVSCGCAEGGDS